MAHDYAVELKAMFHREKILDLIIIGSCFPERSRTSLVRDLCKVCAISSYNHCGRHYTLEEIADFNDNGIWQYKDALFSARGNLKSTIQGIVDESRGGMTHGELRAVLHLRTHDIVRVMASDNQIARESVHGAYVYVSADADVGRAQIAARIAQPLRGVPAREDPMFIIEVLSYAVQHPRATAADVRSHFEGTGVPQCEIDSVYEHYVKGKKN
jgi:hypothetical protein